MDDLRYALRRLRKQPLVTLASVITLAGSTGAAVVMWTLFSALLVRPLPLPRLASLHAFALHDGERIQTGFSFNDYLAARAASTASTFTGWGHREVRIDDAMASGFRNAHFVAANYFDVLGIMPSRGRAFTASDDVPHSVLVAIITDHYWDRAFQRRPDIVGSSIRAGRKAVTIIGVAPRGFRGLDLANPADMFFPLQAIEDIVPTGNFLQRERAKGFSPNAWVQLAGRATPPMSGDDLARSLSAQGTFRASGKTSVVVATPAAVAALPRSDRPTLARFMRLLAAIVALLFAIGCGTTTLLMLVRAQARRVEFATCVALGASRATLARGIAAEAVCLSTAAAFLALPAALLILALLAPFSLPGRIEIGTLTSDIGANAVILAAAGGVVSAVAIISLVFAVMLSPRAMSRLREASNQAPRRAPVRSALIVLQVAAAVTLMAGMMMFVRSLSAAMYINPERDPARIVTVSLQVNTVRWPADRTRAAYKAVAGRLTGNAAIERLSISSWVGGMSRNGRLTIDGVPRRLPAFTEFIGIDAGYLETLELPIVEGRGLGAGDVAGAPLVALASESFARFLGDGGSALGHRVGLFYGAPPAQVEIVGVVPDLVSDVRRLQPFTVYLAIAQHDPSVAMPNQIVLLASRDGNDVAREVLSAARAEDMPLVPLIKTLRDTLYDQMAPQEFGATILGVLGTIAALLTMLGLYVVAESTAAQRTRELGIRAALGATRRDLRQLLARDSLRLGAIGALAGLAIVYSGGGLIRSFLFGIESFDPVTLTVVPSGMVALATLAGLSPALRASRADIAQVLRRE